MDMDSHSLLRTGNTLCGSNVSSGDNVQALWFVKYGHCLIHQLALFALGY